MTRTALALVLAFAVRAAAADLSIGTVSGGPGQVVNLSVTLRTQGAQVAGVQFDLTYATSSLNLTVAAGSAAVAAGKSESVGDIQGGGGKTVLIVGFNQTTMGDGSVADLAIAIGSSVAPGAYPLTLSNVLGVDPSGGAIVLGANNGAVMVVVPPSLTVSKTHAGNFTVGQANAAYTVVVSNQAGAQATSGTVTVADVLPSGLTLVSMSGAGWNCAGSQCARADALGPGSSYPPVGITVNVALTASPQVTNQVNVSGGGSAAASGSDVTAVAAASFTLNPLSASIPAGGGSGTVALASTPANAPWTIGDVPSWIAITSPASGVGSATVSYTVAANGSAAPRSSTVTIAGQAFTVNQAGAPSAGLGFFPVTPCRVADTRAGSGKTGAFGPPTLAANSARDIAIPLSACGIPATAQAYSLNVTVVPPAPLIYLTIWPSGQPQPVVSTLNSFSGAVVANAAIVPAGQAGAVSLYVSDPADVIVDINGYFAVPDAQALAFYPATPCRVADTRNAAGVFGGPSLTGGQTRDFPVASSGCGIPSSAQAYSLNVTVVPPGPLVYLTTGPAGHPLPLVSTLNAPNGGAVANAAIVPAGVAPAVPGAISVFASDPTDIIIDLNGYFAPPGGAGALYFYPATPCRIADTRAGQGKTGGFGPPAMPAGSTRNFVVPASACGIPLALVYSLNMTVVPPGPLTYLSTWPAGQPQPFVSTLNSFDGRVVANAAIVPSGAVSAGSAAISVFVSDLTDLIIDVNGYFAQ